MEGVFEGFEKKEPPEQPCDRRGFCALFSDFWFPTHECGFGVQLVAFGGYETLLFTSPSKDCLNPAMVVEVENPLAKIGASGIFDCHEAVREQKDAPEVFYGREQIPAHMLEKLWLSVQDSIAKRIARVYALSSGLHERFAEKLLHGSFSVSVLCDKLVAQSEDPPFIRQHGVGGERNRSPDGFPHRHAVASLPERLVFDVGKRKCRCRQSFAPEKIQASLSCVGA